MDTFIRQRGTRASPAPHPTLETNKHEIDARKSIFLAYFAPKGSECGYCCCSCRVVQYRRSMAERVSDSIVPANCSLLFPVTQGTFCKYRHLCQAKGGPGQALVPIPPMKQTNMKLMPGSPYFWLILQQKAQSAVTAAAAAE